MIEFEDKYVRFRWDNKLIGKKCFAADNMFELEEAFKAGFRKTVKCGHDSAFPFEFEGGSYYQFVYYDPNYDCKLAFESGKQIQFHCIVDDYVWHDVYNPIWKEDLVYRVKPEESERMTYRELAEWLAKGNGQYTTGGTVYHEIGYNNCGGADKKQLNDSYQIRRWGSDEWIEPTVDVYEKDCREESVE